MKAAERIERVSWDYPQQCWVAMSRDEAVATLGSPQYEAVDGWAPEPVDLWLFRLDCGVEVVLYWLHPHGVATAGLSVQSNDADIDHVLSHLPMLVGRERDRADSFDPAYLRTAGYPQPEPCRVMRQDDNGHVFEVRRCQSRKSAECVAAEFQARPHKQHYWVERVASV